MKKLLCIILSAVFVFIPFLSGMYSPDADISAGAVQQGDADGDGKITAADARKILRVSVDLEDISYKLFNIFDIDNDGKITAADARIALRISVGLKEDSKEKFKNIKIGLICAHDENSLYDKNFIDAARKAADELGFTLFIKTNVGEDPYCLTAAEELAAAGCNVVFANSFGHETYLMTAAEKHPEVQFCSAAGINARASGIRNFHNAYAAIHEGRYVTGVAAGMKINEMIAEGKITAEEAKVGFIGTFPYAEVISAYTAFFLGIRSVCPTASMEVVFTYAWFDIGKEKETAFNLIRSGCILISQHSGSEGAPKTCEEMNVPNVAYNADTRKLGPNTALISSKIDWTPYFRLIAEAAADKKAIPTDYCGNFDTGSVVLTELNKNVAAKGTQEKLDEVIRDLKNGRLKVFDTDTFTVRGFKINSYIADIIPDNNFSPDTEVIYDGYFHESDAEHMRSAPYFNIYIDGIFFPGQYY